MFAQRRRKVEELQCGPCSQELLRDRILKAVFAEMRPFGNKRKHDLKERQNHFQSNIHTWTSSLLPPELVLIPVIHLTSVPFSCSVPLTHYQAFMM